MVLLAPTLAMGLVFAMDAFAADPCKGGDAVACEAYRKANCDTAIEVSIVKARELPARGAAETERKRELVEKIEKRVAERRREGADPCRTWKELMGIAFSQ